MYFVMQSIFHTLGKTKQREFIVPAYILFSPTDLKLKS